jgi:hypothetical protein
MLEKAIERDGQMGCRKVGESEPSMKRREYDNTVKTRALCGRGDKGGGDPEVGRSAVSVEVARAYNRRGFGTREPEW